LAEKGDRRTVFIFLDTDKHVSAFDTLLALDLFPEAEILHYAGVEEEDAQRIITDSMFPRGPSGARHTKLFLGGSDVEKVNRILEIAKKTMFPPFELAVVVDPRGAYTTASAAVAKTIPLLIDPRFNDLKGRTVTVLAGTGPVGTTAAYLYASERARVRITSRSLERAQEASERVNRRLGVELASGFKADDDESIGRAIEGAEIILSTGAQGIQLLSRDVLSKHGGSCRVVADVNAVPPTGVEGLEPGSDGDLFAEGVRGVGALSIGALKKKVEAELLRQAVEAKSGIFDFKVAYRIARSLAAKH